MIILFSYDILLPIIIYFTIMSIIVFLYRADNTKGKTEPFTASINNAESRNPRQVSQNTQDIRKKRKNEQHTSTDNTSNNVSKSMVTETHNLKEKAGSIKNEKLRQANSLKDQNKQNECDAENKKSTSTYFHKTNSPKENTRCFYEGENNFTCENIIKRENDSIRDKTTSEIKNDDLFESYIIGMIYNQNKAIKQSKEDVQFCIIHFAKDPLPSTNSDTVLAANDFRLNVKETGKNSLNEAGKSSLTDKYTNSTSPNDLLSKHGESNVKEMVQKYPEFKKIDTKKFLNPNTSIIDDRNRLNLFDLDFEDKFDNVNEQHSSINTGEFFHKNIPKDLTKNVESQGFKDFDKNNFNHKKPSTEQTVDSKNTSIFELPDTKSQIDDSNNSYSPSSTKTGMDNLASSSTPHHHNFSRTSNMKATTSCPDISYTPKPNSMVKDTLAFCTNTTQKTTNQIRLRRSQSCPNMYYRSAEAMNQEESHRSTTEEHNNSPVLDSHTEINNELQSSIPFDVSNRKLMPTGKLDSVSDISMSSNNVVSSDVFNDPLAVLDYNDPQLEYDSLLPETEPNDISPSLDYYDFFSNIKFDDNVHPSDGSRSNTSIENDNYEELESEASDILESHIEFDDVFKSDCSRSDTSNKNDNYEEFKFKGLAMPEEDKIKEYYETIFIDSDEYETSNSGS